MMGGDSSQAVASQALASQAVASQALNPVQASAAQQQLAIASAAQAQASAAQGQASGAQNQDSGAQQQASAAQADAAALAAAASAAQQLASAAQPGSTVPLFLTPKLDVSYYPKGPFGSWTASDTLAYVINPQGAMHDLCPPGFQLKDGLCVPSLPSANGQCPTGWTFNAASSKCMVSMAGLPLTDPSLTSSGAIPVANLPTGTMDVSGATDFTKLIPLDTNGMIRQMYFMLLEAHRDRRFMGSHGHEGSSGARDGSGARGDSDDKDDSGRGKGKGKGQDSSQIASMITTINGKIDALIDALTDVSKTTDSTDKTVATISNKVNNLDTSAYGSTQGGGARRTKRKNRA